MNLIVILKQFDSPVYKVNHYPPIVSGHGTDLTHQKGTFHTFLECLKIAAQTNISGKYYNMKKLTTDAG